MRGARGGATTLVLVGALLAGGCAPPLAAATPIEEFSPAEGVSATRRLFRYEVRGSTPAELRAAMNRIGPLDGGDRRTDAATHTYIRWRYDDQRTADACAPRNPRVSLQITLFMPAWSPPADAAAADVARWSRYTGVLLAHERVHERIGVETAVEMLAVLRAVTPRPTCEELSADVHHLVDAVFDRMAERNEGFDRETRHGATQGATFP